ncbi:acyclic terpene utilization AtuA family protein [Actinomadura physcomitrii]|uniref:acyclic terpene utilization AtuA family protein n=1 Tax=Actinomadura physcomitrii TaxID=2650748 RepID=UPI001F3B4417|nr:acyclic terpene utilization AtuA family protein [Actinomadura physcomitrii]
MRNRAVRIANFSGYLGDRRSAFDEAMAGDPVDVLVGDYLAEITMAGVSAALDADRQALAGFSVGYFLEQICPHLAAVAEHDLKIVVNAGAFDPAGLAERVRAAAAHAGVELDVAHVEGDGVLHRLEDLRAAGYDLAHLDTRAPLDELAGEPIAANAYLGGWGITAALREGADIVVCGRVTDASLVTGPTAWWHDWGREDWDRLAGAVVAGHIIECGAQAAGGNFAGFTRLPGMLRPGFPIAEIAADGGSVITKHGADEGAVTVDTVTAQLVYEIQGPHYLNPDVTVDMGSVRLRQAGRDRVQVSPVTGAPPPPTTKVAIYAPAGYQIGITTHLTGLDVEEKAGLLERQVRRIAAEAAVDELVVGRHGTPVTDPRTQDEATIGFRVAAAAERPEPLQRLSRETQSLGLSSIPGFMGVESAGPKRRIDYWPGLLPQEVLDHKTVLQDGRRIAIDSPKTEPFHGQPVHPEPEPPPPTPTERVPLGRIAYARSGDKGGNSNLGIWTDVPEAWPWLRAALTTSELRRLLPETENLTIVRYEFPHLRAVHFVLCGLLGNAGSSNLRLDVIGKAVGEHVRARLVDVPAALLAAAP